MAFDTTELKSLFRAVVDLESVSTAERALADEVEATLRTASQLEVTRVGNTVVARTQLARLSRVIFAGHLDTVPLANNLPSKFVEDERGLVLKGRGAADMKSGLTVMLTLAKELKNPSRDLTWIFYDCEEIDQASNGLGRLVLARPDLVKADLAILLEPTSAQIEGGCQGTIRGNVTVRGRAAHSARSWLGQNAIHDAAEVIERVKNFTSQEIVLDGLTYREGLNITTISGGSVGNIVPDSCTLQINYRFAPDKSPDEALAIVQNLLDGYDFELLDLSPGARPGLDADLASGFVRAVGATPKPKYGWTDVARFSQLGIPALNYGPGDPGEAHTIDESCPLSHLTSCIDAIRRWLNTEET